MLESQEKRKARSAMAETERAPLMSTTKDKKKDTNEKAPTQ